MDYHSCRQERTLNRFLVFPVPHPPVVVPPSSSCFLAAHCNGVYTRNASVSPPLRVHFSPFRSFLTASSGALERVTELRILLSRLRPVSGSHLLQLTRRLTAMIFALRLSECFGLSESSGRTKFVAIYATRNVLVRGVALFYLKCLLKFLLREISRLS